MLIKPFVNRYNRYSKKEEVYELLATSIWDEVSVYAFSSVIIGFIISFFNKEIGK